MTIGPQNRMAAYSPEVEEVLLYTVAGQADLPEREEFPASYIARV
jgi:hypothetical protein